MVRRARAGVGGMKMNSPELRLPSIPLRLLSWFAEAAYEAQKHGWIVPPSVNVILLKVES